MSERHKWFPDEHLELHFQMESEDSFTVDKTIVEVGMADHPADNRHDDVKTWVIADGDLERTITEDEVVAVMPALKAEYRDSEGDGSTFRPFVEDDEQLPTPWEPADPEDRP